MRARRGSDPLNWVDRFVPRPAGAIMGRAPAASTNAPVFLCAEISHTQGAAEYALLAFLTLAVRAYKELGELLPPLWVVLPTSAYGKSGRVLRQFLGDFFTLQSLHALSRTAGFAFFEDVHHNHALWEKRASEFCSKSAFDIRIGAAATSTLPAEATPEASLAPNYTQMHADPGGLGNYFQQVWAYLREAVRRNRERRQGLRVCFTLMQFWPGPLDHAAAFYPVEAHRVVRALQFAPAPWSARPADGTLPSAWGASETAASRCAYAFFSNTLEFTSSSRHGSASTGGGGRRADTWVASPFLANASRAVIKLARDAGLGCAVINAITHPFAAAESMPSVFAESDAQFKTIFATKEANDEAGPTGSSLSANRNLHERFLASTSPLFITTAGTHWSDWLLYKRTLAGRPSAIIGDPTRDAHVRAPSPPALFACGTIDGASSTECEVDCAFYRSVCINRSAFPPAPWDFGDALYDSPHGGYRRTAKAEGRDGTLTIV